MPTLEVFSRLGFLDLDLNLGHMIEGHVSVDAVRQRLAAGGQRVWVASGGWCDFYHREPEIETSFASVDRQARIARQLGVGMLRLFFGRLKSEEYTRQSRDTICTNLRRLSDQHPDIALMFENHDGASLRPEICRDVLESVDRPNVLMNFDPINFERGGTSGMEALRTLRALIGHVHLKGVQDGECCEFGVGDVDLTPLIRSLIEGGYTASFTVEYEGRFDRTVRLYESVQRARAAVAAFLGGNTRTR